MLSPSKIVGGSGLICTCNPWHTSYFAVARSVLIGRAGVIAQFRGNQMERWLIFSGVNEVRSGSVVDLGVCYYSLDG